MVVKEFDPNLPIDKIVVAEENPRRTELMAGLDELKQSIVKFGLIQPVVVIPDKGKYRLIVGKRRYLAFKELSRKTIPALIIGSIDTTSQAIVSFGENLQRRELPYEDTINVCDVLFNEYSGSKADKIRKIASDLGVSTSIVTRYLAHRLVPKPVRKLVEEGKLTEDRAYRITTALWPDEQKILAMAKRVTRLTKSESRRALDIAKKKPKESVEDIISEAKQPKPVYEIVIPLDPESAERLEQIAKDRKTDVKNLVLGLITSLLEGGKSS